MQIITIVVGLIQTNCYLFINEVGNETIIIDPGDNFTVIQEKCTQYKFNPAAVLLTHGHFDHIMAADALRKAYNIPIYASELEKELLTDARLNASELLIRKPYILTADKWLHDGDLVYGMQVISTAGHTTGSVCFYAESEKVLFTGDTLFKESHGRTDFPTGDFEALKHSILEKLFRLPDDTVVYPGHNGKTSIGYEKKYNMINSY